MSDELKRTPLYARHAAAGAKLVPFAGFEMPVVYDSILEEHRAVRSGAGLFDVSHMGELRVQGPDAASFVQQVFTNDVAGMAPGRVRYGLLCDEGGGAIDDVTLYRVADDDLLFCVNAANTVGDLAWLQERHQASGLDCTVEDESADTALLAIQGPLAIEIARRVLPGEAPRPRRWRFAQTRFSDVPLWLSRTGYTGEDGYELYVPAKLALELWDALLEAGAGTLRPIGLGARDTLRTEMGYPLYGHELDLEHNPIEAGLERFLAFGRGFCGEQALTRAKASGPARRLVGVILDGRRVARTGARILGAPDGEQVIGSVTSGTYSPSIERSIAIGYVSSPYAQVGTRLGIDVGNRRVACTVTEIPFYRKG